MRAIFDINQAVFFMENNAVLSKNIEKIVITQHDTKYYYVNEHHKYAEMTKPFETKKQLLESL